MSGCKTKAPAPRGLLSPSLRRREGGRATGAQRHSTPGRGFRRIPPMRHTPPRGSLSPLVAAQAGCGGTVTPPTPAARFRSRARGPCRRRGSPSPCGGTRTATSWSMKPVSWCWKPPPGSWPTATPRWHGPPATPTGPRSAHRGGWTSTRLFDPWRQDWGSGGGHRNSRRRAVPGAGFVSPESPPRRGYRCSDTRPPHRLAAPVHPAGGSVAGEQPRRAPGVVGFIPGAGRRGIHRLRGALHTRTDHRGLDMYVWTEEGGIGEGEGIDPGPANPSPNGEPMTYYSGALLPIHQRLRLLVGLHLA